MSHPVRDKMLDLDNDLDGVLLPPAAAIRAYGQRRARRRMAVAGVAVTTAIVAGGVVGAMTFSPPRGGGGTTYGASAPEASCAVSSYLLDLTLPATHTIEVSVLDGAGGAQRAESAADQLRGRGFEIVRTGVASSPRFHITETAQLMYGPSAVGAAQVLKAFVDGRVAMLFDPDRTDRTVDIVIGASFGRLRTLPEANQALAKAGPPTAPPTVCASRRPGE